MCNAPVVPIQLSCCLLTVEGTRGSLSQGRVPVENVNMGVFASEFGSSQLMGDIHSRVFHACSNSCLSVTTASNANEKGLLCSEAVTGRCNPCYVL